MVFYTGKTGYFRKWRKSWKKGRVMVEALVLICIVEVKSYFTLIEI